MSKVLLDVGAHTGETLTVALHPKWGFDRIFSFEPAPSCWDGLESLADPRVTVLRFGLWASDERLNLYESGEIGASIHPRKSQGSTFTVAEFRDAATWFAENIDPQDEVIVKLNCEGAECDVLDRLIDTGEIGKVDELLIHFDVRKIPGMEHREHSTRRALRAAGVSYRTADSLFFGRNTQEKTINWLSWRHSGRVGRLKYSVLRRAEFFLRVKLYNLRHL